MLDIKTIGAELATQDNRSTQYPLFVVQVDEKQYVNYLDSWEHKERVNLDAVDFDEFYKDLCSSCRQLFDNDDELQDDCNTCASDSFWYYNIAGAFDLQAGVFLTAKACDEHIASNHYHYNKPRSYGISAWRNYEMQAVMQHLIKAAGKEVPSHYA